MDTASITNSRKVIDLQSEGLEPDELSEEKVEDKIVRFTVEGSVLSPGCPESDIRVVGGMKGCSVEGNRVEANDEAGNTRFLSPKDKTTSWLYSLGT